VAKYGQLLHERRLRERAKRRGVSVEQERRDTLEHLRQASAQPPLAEIEAQQDALVERALDQAR